MIHLEKGRSYRGFSGHTLSCHGTHVRRKKEGNHIIMAEENEVKKETMDDFAKEIDHSMREIHVGDIIDGTVTGVTDNEVMVDLQYYAPGLIRAQDYSADPDFSLKTDVHPGDAIKATVLRMDDGKGNLLLSRREAIADLVWDEFKKMMDEKTETELKISEAVKAGVVGYLNGVRAFVPASQLSLSYVENLEDFVGKTIPVRIITADKEHDRLVVGSRDLLREKRDAERAERISNIKPGLVTEGTVQSLQSYGAFVSLGDGVDGLVHISRITNKKRLKHPKEVLSVGDKVKVKVIAVKDGKISLSMKDLEEDEAKPVEEEKVTLPKSEELTTNLGSLLKNIKL